MENYQCFQDFVTVSGFKLLNLLSWAFPQHLCLLQLRGLSDGLTQGVAKLDPKLFEYFLYKKGSFCVCFKVSIIDFAKSLKKYSFQEYRL